MALSNSWGLDFRGSETNRAVGTTSLSGDALAKTKERIFSKPTRRTQPAAASQTETARTASKALPRQGLGRPGVPREGRQRRSGGPQRVVAHFDDHRRVFESLAFQRIPWASPQLASEEGRVVERRPPPTRRTPASIEQVLRSWATVVPDRELPPWGPQGHRGKRTGDVVFRQGLDLVFDDGSSPFPFRPGPNAQEPRPNWPSTTL